MPINVCCNCGGTGACYYQARLCPAPDGTLADVYILCSQVPMSTVDGVLQLFFFKIGSTCYYIDPADAHATPGTIYDISQLVIFASCSTCSGDKYCRLNLCSDGTPSVYIMAQSLAATFPSGVSLKISGTCYTIDCSSPIDAPGMGDVVVGPGGFTVFSSCDDCATNTSPCTPCPGFMGDVEGVPTCCIGFGTQLLVTFTIPPYTWDPTNYSAAFQAFYDTFVGTHTFVLPLAFDPDHPEASFDTVCGGTDYWIADPPDRSKYVIFGDVEDGAVYWASNFIAPGLGVPNLGDFFISFFYAANGALTTTCCKLMSVDGSFSQLNFTGNAGSSLGDVGTGFPTGSTLTLQFLNGSCCTTDSGVTCVPGAGCPDQDCGDGGM